jgi:putative lipoic acid-binding regulatory protein
VTEETLMEFPCQFPIKVFGKDSEDFRSTTLEIIETHAGLLGPEKITERLSGGGRFLALTYTIEARSKEQLDTIYHSLSACEHVMMAL